jgi:hypothetical protein
MSDSGGTLVYLANHIPPFCMLLGSICGFAFVIKYNLISRRLKQRIEAISRLEGGWWTYSNPETAFKLAFKPESLLDPNDTTSMREAKEALLEHRRLLPRYFALSACCLGAGVVFGIVSLLLMATFS